MPNLSCCRICSSEFNANPIISYDGMPQSAQQLPNKKTISQDKGIALEVVQCSSCGVVQLTSEPVSYFREVIRASAVSIEMSAHRQHQFLQFVDQYRLEGKKVVEIGCGRGEYLQILAGCDVDASGIEYGLDSVSFAREIGLDVTQMFIETGDEIIPDGPFEGFLLLNFLEHLPDPSSVLAGIHKNLRAGGIGLVEVPNFDMIVEKSLFTEFVADHLFYFSRDTLSTTLTRNGFNLISCDESWHGYTISAVVQKREPIHFSKADDLRNQMCMEFESFLNQYPNKQVAIWGAGHQAFAVMSLANLKDKICYVVDSALFKQDHFTPGTHIPIVSPEKFFDEPACAIVVIAGSYTSEVVDIIKGKYLDNVDIAILENYKLEVVSRNG